MIPLINHDLPRYIYIYIYCKFYSSGGPKKERKEHPYLFDDDLVYLGGQYQWIGL